MCLHADSHGVGRSDKPVLAPNLALTPINVCQVLRGPPATLADSLTKTTVSNSQHAPRGAVKPAATVELQVGMMKINQFLQMARLDNVRSRFVCCCQQPLCMILQLEVSYVMIVHNDR